MTILDFGHPLPVDALPALTLTAGAHDDRASGVCAMEAVAWLAGEGHARAAARDAARAAARAAAWDAARAAAWDAATAALAPTVLALQESASSLVRELCAMSEVAEVG